MVMYLRNISIPIWHAFIDQIVLQCVVIHVKLAHVMLNHYKVTLFYHLGYVINEMIIIDLFCI